MVAPGRNRRPTHLVPPIESRFGAPTSPPRLDEFVRRRLVMHDPQSFCDFVVRWLAQDPKGQELVEGATPDLPPGTAREERLERGAQRLAKSQTFIGISRTLIVPWLSSSSRKE